MSQETSTPETDVVAPELTDTPTAESAEPVKKKRGRKPSGKRDEYYVLPEEFLSEIQTFYETEVITPELGVMIHKIATGLGHAHNFINYSYREEMIGDALIRMYQALRKKKYIHGPGRSPFSYFNTIAHHAFLNRIKKEKRNGEAVSKYQEEIYPELMWELCDASGRKAIHQNNE